MIYNYDNKCLLLLVENNLSINYNSNKKYSFYLNLNMKHKKSSSNFIISSDKRRNKSE